MPACAFCFLFFSSFWGGVEPFSVCSFMNVPDQAQAERRKSRKKQIRARGTVSARGIETFFKKLR